MSDNNFNQTGPVVGPATSFMENCRGKKLHCSYWKPSAGNVRGLVFLSHGFSEHLQWYEELALRLTPCGLLVFGHDHIGHGRSEGHRGHVSTVQEYISDVVTHCEKIIKENKGKPCFLFGHSMGGLIAIRAAMSKPSLFAGVVLMGPLIRPNPEEATSFKLGVARIIASLLPLMPVGKLPLTYVTRDEEMQKKMSKDPLRYHGGVRARWAIACHKELELLHQSVEEVTWPFCILHGAKDRLCLPDGSKSFYKESRSKDKKLKIFPDALHHLFLEIPEVRNEALQNTVDWIVDRLPKDEEGLRITDAQMNGH